jgi:hypothetical protein
VIVGRSTALILLGCLAAIAQDLATLTVTVVDPTAAVVPEAEVILTDLSRGGTTKKATNESGFAVFDFLAPGEYALDTVKTGFEQHRVDLLILKVRDRQLLRVELKVAAASGTKIEVTDRVETTSSDAAQGISMDQRYLQNLPANGRNAESLVLMTPGISSAAGGNGGGFNTNGLRSNTNYYTLDGVSMNLPTGGGGPGGPGGPMGGGPPAAAPGSGSSTQMISIDAMQEMKVQTSSFAPEFGRTPGAQVVMTSRGGGNGFHGSLFYYARRKQFDANDWFANSRGYPRAEERQNRPGGVLGGPIIRNKTFFFLSFEKLNLLSPESVIAEVPDLAFRNSVPAALRPYVNVFPLPNGEELSDGAAEYRAILSNPSSNYSASGRLDHLLSSRTTLFARYSLSPSKATQRGSQMSTPNIVTGQSSHSQTVTVGATHVFAGGEINDIRASWSASSSAGASFMDDFGGAVPLKDSQVFPSGITSATGTFSLSILGVSSYSYGSSSASNQQQVNVVDSFTKSSGNHHYKAGVDYRRILQTTYRKPYSVNVSFNGLEATSTSGTETYPFIGGVALNGQVSSSLTAVYPKYMNLSAYAQDTWRATERTTVTYGLRWDLNPAPTTRQGPLPFALSDNAIAGVTQNEPIYPTRWFDVAPRIGVAYLSDDTPGREMMLRAGLGVFYDMGYGVVGGAFNGAPYSNVRTLSEVAFPLSAANLAAPGMPATRPYGQITTGATGLSSPKVVQWNGTWEKNFGTGEMLSVGAVGTRGINLMRTDTQMSSNVYAYQVLSTVSNGAASWYNGLHVQFRKRVSENFQTQWSYTWSHAVDSSSNDMGMGGGFASLFGSGQRGSSDYDVRHNASFSGMVRLPGPGGPVLSQLLKHWYLDFVVAARSGLPFDLQGVSCSNSSSSSSSSSTSSSSTTSCSKSVSSGSANGLFAQVRPSYNGGTLWIEDSNAPGGRRLNKGAFYLASGYSQGNLGRNSLRGFGFAQLDLSLRRSISLAERLNLSIAAQGYNILNHPNFANPTASEGANMSSPNFGIATQMMNQSFGGGVNSLYRSGGARSMELSLRLQF